MWKFLLSPCNALGRVLDFRTRGCWCDFWILHFLRIDDSYCDKINSSHSDEYCFDNGPVGKQPVA